MRGQSLAEAVVMPEKAGPLVRLGRRAMDHLAEGYALLVFLGEVSLVLLRTLLDPRRLRFKAFLHNPWWG